MLHVQEAGPVDAPSIVFLHGAGVAGWMWQPQMAALSRDFHCLIPDLPGHGRSPDADPFTLADCTAQTAELIRHRAHGGRAHVVGLSMGACVTMQLLADYPALVERAIVSGPAGGPMGRPILALLRLLLPLARTEFMLRQSAKALKLPPELYEPFRQSQLRLTSTTFDQIMGAIDQFRTPEALSAISTPLLVVVGQKETSINYRNARQALGLQPRAVGRIAPGVGHSWNGENPDLFNRMVRAWVTAAPLPDELLPLV
jgi:pimeloyl-ACP methyl ester carboxylesterase